MGYRLRIGKISDEAYNKYQNIETEEEVKRIAGLGEGDGVYNSLPEYRELYELGKYVDHSIGTKPFFKFELTDGEFQIASRDWLLTLIDEYRKRTADWYELLSKALIEKRPVSSNENTKMVDYFYINKELDEETNVFPTIELFRHVINRRDRWRGNFLKPYELDTERGVITNDWSYEYSAFNLVHILHTFDWKNDLLIYSGW